MSMPNEATQNSIIGVWAPVAGNPADTVEYRADGTVRMAMFAGAYLMNGTFRFVDADVIEIGWGVSSSAEATNVVNAVNDGLREKGADLHLGIVTRSVLQVAVTQDELKTLHIEKGRVGHFRRVS